MPKSRLIARLNTVLPQFRCLPLVGRFSSFRYVLNVPGCKKEVNHDDIVRAVGEFNSKSRKSGGLMLQDKQEIIQPWVACYRDSRGVIMETIGVDVANHRVLFERPRYPHSCALPRELWGRKFKRLTNER